MNILFDLANAAKNIGDNVLANTLFAVICKLYLNGQDSLFLSWETNDQTGGWLSDVYYDLPTISLLEPDSDVISTSLCIPAPLLHKDTLVCLLKAGSAKKHPLFTQKLIHDRNVVPNKSDDLWAELGKLMSAEGVFGAAEEILDPKEVDLEEIKEKLGLKNNPELTEKLRQLEAVFSKH